MVRTKQKSTRATQLAATLYCTVSEGRNTALRADQGYEMDFFY